MAQIVIIGPQTGPRAEAFQGALARLGRPRATFVAYDQLLRKPDTLARVLSSGDILRFDSPDRHAPSLGALYCAGQTDAEVNGFVPLHGKQLDAILSRKGAIGSPSQLWYGLRRALYIAHQVADEVGAHQMADVQDVAETFDKTACGQRCLDPEYLFLNNLVVFRVLTNSSRLCVSRLNRAYF